LKKKRDLSDDFRLLDIFDGRCPMCRSMATTIHELEPRSRGERSMRFTNRTPICDPCHNEFHRLGASEKNIGKWKKQIEKYLTQIGRLELYVDG
jgi:5-methylcytosine-specific restriction endonuclease McrA